MLETKTIAGILYLEIKEKVNVNILDLTDFIIKVTNLPSAYKNILDSSVSQIIGLNEQNFIINNKIVLLNEFTYDISLKDFDPHPNLHKILVISEYYCQALWLIKDNAVQLELAHLIYKSKTHKHVHSNYWNTSYSNAIGKRISTKFTEVEIRESKHILKSIMSIVYTDDQKVDHKNVVLTNKISRLSRSFIFLKSARTTNDIGTKISLYCSVFESLFSVSNTELRHRLSETISFFLSENFDERMFIYKTIQKAYDIRSSIVHGDGLQKRFLKNNNELLFEIAVNTDEILRKCFRKILRNSEYLELFRTGNQEELLKFFQNLIFKQTMPNNQYKQ